MSFARKLEVGFWVWESRSRAESELGSHTRTASDHGGEWREGEESGGTRNRERPESRWGKRVTARSTRLCLAPDTSRTSAPNASLRVPFDGSRILGFGSGFDLKPNPSPIFPRIRFEARILWARLGSVSGPSRHLGIVSSFQPARPSAGTWQPDLRAGSGGVLAGSWRFFLWSPDFWGHSASSSNSRMRTFLRFLFGMRFFRNTSRNVLCQPLPDTLNTQKAVLMFARVARKVGRYTNSLALAQSTGNACAAEHCRKVDMCHAIP